MSDSNVSIQLRYIKDVIFEETVVAGAEELSPSYKIEDKGKYWFVNLGESLEVEGATQLSTELTVKNQTNPRDVIIDCGEKREIPNVWLRTLVQLNQKMKASQCQLRLVVSPSFAKVLQEEGLSGSMKSSKTLQLALKELGHGDAPSGTAAGSTNPSPVKVNLDVNFINPFLSATLKTLDTQASIKSKASKIFTKPANEKFSGDISGVIGIVSEKFKGSVVISFPEATFLKIMSKMLGEDFKELTKEIEDGAGELTNIIFGLAKQELNERGYGINMAVPSVVTGKDHSIQQLASGGPRVVIPFTTDAGPFMVEICISE